MTLGSDLKRSVPSEGPHALAGESPARVKAGIPVRGDVAPIIPLTGGEERVKVIRCRLQGKHREK